MAGIAQSVQRLATSWTVRRLKIAPIQTGSGAHPAFHSVDTTPGSGVDHLPSSSTQVKERVEP